MQPYKMKPGKETIHPLWHLAKLSNLDKHQTLALSALGSSCVCTFTHPDGRQHHSEFTNAVVHDGSVIASMPIDFLHPKVKSEIKVTCQVSFCDAPVRDLEVINILQMIREWLGQLVLPAFEPFFDKLPDDLRLRSHGLPREMWPRDRKPMDT
jgi:hypothetical protein